MYTPNYDKQDYHLCGINLLDTFEQHYSLKLKENEENIIIKT